MTGFIRRGPYALAAGMLSSPVWIPLEEAAWRRGVFVHRVSALPIGLVGRTAPTVPFGWSVERDEDRCAWVIGPSWYLLPRRWYRNWRSRFYRFAIEVGAATCPYEGCYYSELEWWPKGPRMTAYERWQLRNS